MKQVFTLSDIKEAWSSFKTDKAIKVLKEGVWYTRPAGVNPLREDGVTQAKMVTCSEAMTFPEFLEKHYD